MVNGTQVMKNKQELIREVSMRGEKGMEKGIKKWELLIKVIKTDDSSDGKSSVNLEPKDNGVFLRF